MKIEVTQNAIEQGDRKEPGSCPIALAIMEAMPEARNVEVHTSEVRFNLGKFDASGGYISHTLAHDAEAWIGEFDSGIPVAPITVNLDSRFSRVRSALDGLTH